MIQTRRAWCRAVVGTLLWAVAPAARGQQLPAVRIATTPNDPYAQAFFAKDMGFFQRAGLDADVTTMANGSAISEAVASGALDFGISNPVQLANAVTRGVGFVFVAPGAMSNAQSPAGLVCVAASSNIRVAKDLEGKVVAVSSLRSGQELSLDAWLTKNGADYTKIRTVESVISDMAPGVERGAFAAGIIGEPFLSPALKSGDVRSIGDPFAAVSPNFLLSVWFATRTFAQQHPDVVRRFDEAITEAGTWANGHQSESAAILAKYAKIDVAVIRRMTRSVFADAMRPADIQPVLDAGARYGILPRPVAASELLGN